MEGEGFGTVLTQSSGVIRRRSVWVPCPAGASQGLDNQTVARKLRAGLSRMTLSRIWHAFGSQPHRSDTFKLPPDRQWLEKVRDRFRRWRVS